MADQLGSTHCRISPTRDCFWQEIEDLKWLLPQCTNVVVHEASKHGSPCFVFKDSHFA